MKAIVIGVVVVAAWVAALAWGLHATMSYETTPGRAAAVPRLSLATSQKDWSVVMVAHPLCPCTVASLKALKAVASEHSARVDYRIVFVGERPQELTTNMEIAQEIPDVSIDWVSEDTAAQKYGSYTSGQVFVFAKKGNLAFSGGVTPGRGVDQPMYAVRFFRRLFAGEPTETSGPVFGCGLQTEKK